ncbi:MAG: DUF1883 domain-containing protein [Flavobacteriales bacterium]|nr:DUF1883 domain-containing protein [Flavobacteriales bacterium]
MKFLFRKYPAKKGEVIEVEPSAPTVVKFMTSKEFKNYAGGRTHTYYKGQQEDELIRFSLPFDSIWYAVVEKGDEAITAKCKLCAAPPASENWIQAPEAEAELESLGTGEQSEE